MLGSRGGNGCLFNGRSREYMSLILQVHKKQQENKRLWSLL